MPVPLTPLFPGVPGGTELAVILLLAILLFGANKIPKLARSTGEAMGEFKKGREQVERELEELREGPSAEPVETDGTGSATTEPSTETAEAPETSEEPDTDVETEPETEER